MSLNHFGSLFFFTIPKRSDINSVPVIGSGPIVIGQVCEFDYSGTQACKAFSESRLRICRNNGLS
ncbi:MAG: hypothetical protein MUF71_01350 [Candidatus Kapabacteria bacterium]|nr:hypothetical protein [Candidatus Kapabacteria bacterium]